MSLLFHRRPLFSLALAVATRFVTAAPAPYTATWTPGDIAPQTEQGQTGTNVCGTTDSQNSTCQTLYFNSLDDWCLWAPPEPNSEVGATEEIEVAWCNAAGRGTRLIPPGTIQGAHMRRTPEYVEITGYGDLTKLNIRPGDAGGELDPHGATGNGNPVGGVVFSDAFSPGKVQQIHEWMNFMSASEFCFRICNPASPNAWLYCQHVYDVMGCAWVMPGVYSEGFDDCPMNADSPPGIVNWGQPGASTFRQGDPVTPAAAPAPSSSNCKPYASLAYGLPARVVDGNGTEITASSPTPTPTPTPTNIRSSTSASPTGANNHSGASRLARPAAVFAGLVLVAFAI